jgi:hypothetical protein
MDWGTLFSTAAGGLIAIGGIVVNSYFENEREWKRLAIEAAIEDNKADASLLVANPGREMAPMAAYIFYHVKFLNLVRKDKVTVEAINNIRVRRDEFWPHE